MADHFRYFLLCTLTALLAACSEKPKEKTEVSTPHDHVWNAQTQALEKARAVERQILDAATEKDRVIDTQSR